MKQIKLDHELAEAVLSGTKRSTWRLYDDKDLRVDDQAELIDKVNPDDPASWVNIGTASIHKVVEQRLGDITPEEAVGHESFSTKEEMLKVYQGYYGPQVSLETPVKLIYFDFIPVSADSSKLPQRVSKVKMFADGGSRGNPGPSASGFVVLDYESDKVLVDTGIYLGITTNNQAEYQALKFGLEEALKLGASEVDVYMDSLLVVNQMKNIFKVKNRDLWPINEAIRQLVKSFKHVSFTHVPRELNKLADAAVNRALDEQLGITPSRP